MEALENISKAVNSLELVKYGQLIRETLVETLGLATEIVLNPMPTISASSMTSYSFRLGSLLEDSAPRYQGVARCGVDCYDIFCG
jgi:hypothetical protein